MVAIVLDRIDGKEVRLDHVDSVDSVRQWFRKLTVEDLLMLRHIRIIVEEGEGEKVSESSPVDIDELRQVIQDELRQLLLTLLAKRIDIRVEHVHTVRILDIVREIAPTAAIIDQKSTSQEVETLQDELGNELEILKRRIEELERDPAPIKEYIRRKIADKRFEIYLAELQEVFLGRRLKYWESPQTKFLALRFNKIVKRILEELERELGGKFVQRTVSRYKDTTGKFIVFIYSPPQAPILSHLIFT